MALTCPAVVIREEMSLASRCANALTGALEPIAFDYEIWLRVMRRLVYSYERGREGDRAVDLTREQLTIVTVLSTCHLLRRALLQQFMHITRLSINENRSICSSSDGIERYALGAPLLAMLIRNGAVKLTSVAFGDDIVRCLDQNADFIEDIVTSSEHFIDKETPMQSLLRFCITPGGPMMSRPDSFLAELHVGASDNVSPVRLDNVRALLTSSMLWFNKRGEGSSTRRNPDAASLTSLPCASKLYRILNLDARELEINFALIEEDEFIDFVELLGSDHYSQDHPPIDAKSTTSFRLIDEFMLSPSDLRIPVREYGKLIDFALAHMPSLTQLHFAIDCHYRSGVSTTARVVRNNLAKIFDRNVEIVNVIDNAIRAAGQARNLSCSVNYVLRGKRLRDFAKDLVDSHELFKMMGGEKNVERNEFVNRIIVKTKRRDSSPTDLLYCMEFQFID